jgi:hypothetical protein
MLEIQQFQSIACIKQFQSIACIKQFQSIACIKQFQSIACIKQFQSIACIKHTKPELVFSNSDASTKNLHAFSPLIELRMYSLHCFVSSLRPRSWHSISKWNTVCGCKFICVKKTHFGYTPNSLAITQKMLIIY